MPKVILLQNRMLVKVIHPLHLASMSNNFTFIVLENINGWERMNAYKKAIEILHEHTLLHEEVIRRFSILYYNIHY